MPVDESDAACRAEREAARRQRSWWPDDSQARYAVSQRKRKRIEECFGWLKTIALMRKVRHRSLAKVGWVFTFAAAAYNLVRMRNLLARTVEVL